MVERESQQISRRGETGRAFVIGARVERFETETSRPRKISSGRMKNRRTESSNFSLSPPLPREIVPISASWIVRAHRRERKSYYRVSIHDIIRAPMAGPCSLSCGLSCSREKGRVRLCVFWIRIDKVKFTSLGARAAH